jgi:hypothetical protein
MIFRAAFFLLCLGLAAEAQVTFTTMTSADAFVCTGSPGNPELGGADLTGLNFGGAGTLAIAPASSIKGEFRSLIRFDLSNAVIQFNTNYGAGNWTISNLSLELASNWGQDGAQPNNPIFNTISGGQFVIEWMSDDGWDEGMGDPQVPGTDGITYASLPGLLSHPHVPLCTNLYVPPGANVHLTWDLPLETNLVADAAAGGRVSFYFYAADDRVGYLFNSHSYGRGNEPLIHVTAAGRPAPFKWLSGSFTNGVFALHGAGQAGSNYQVQACTVLTGSNWQTVGAAAADASGLIEFYDAGAATNLRRFYRLAR